MTLVDANLLLYAVNKDAPHHTRARRWLESTFGGGEPVGLSWSVIFAFLRLTTRAGLFSRPLSIDQAFDLTPIGCHNQLYESCSRARAISRFSETSSSPWALPAI
jgi:hypothetical protein